MRKLANLERHAVSGGIEGWIGTGKWPDVNLPRSALVNE